jgi:hypothetical protein
MNSSLTRKLETAVTILTGHGALKDRLALAYSNCLEHLDEQDLPEETQSEFSQMSVAMHRARALPGDTIVRASIRKLSNEEALHFATLVVRIYGLRMADLSAARAPVRSAPQRNATPLAALLALEGSGVSASTHGKVAGRVQRA